MGKCKTSALVATTLFCAVTTLKAQEWEFSVGATYRTFKNIELAPVPFQNPNPNYSTYINGAFQPGAPDQLTGDMLFDVDPPLDNTGGVGLAQTNVTITDRNATVGTSSHPFYDVATNGDVVLDKFANSGGDSAADSSAEGLVLGLEKKVGMLGEENLTWAWSLSLVYMNPDVHDNVSASVSSDIFGVPAGALYSAGNMSDNPFGGTFIGATTPPVLDLPSTTAGTMEYDIDSDVYTFGFGARGYYSLDRFDLSLALGPTVTVVDLEAEVTEKAFWISGRQEGQYVYAPQSHRDSTVQVELGAFAALGLEYHLTEQLGLALEYRYDILTGEIETKYADLDLEGGSGTLKFTYSF